MQLKNFSPPPPSGGRLNGPFYYGRASKTRGKKHSSTIYLFQLPVEYLLSKKGRRKKKWEGMKLFCLKKRKRGREIVGTHSRINEKVILKERSRPPFFFDEGHQRGAPKSIYFHSIIIIIIIVINTNYYSPYIRNISTWFQLLAWMGWAMLMPQFIVAEISSLLSLHV